MSEAPTTNNDTSEWGFFEDNTFVSIPKPPLLMAGYTNPPFTVVLPNGLSREIIERPQEVSFYQEVERAEPVPIAPSKIKVTRKIKVYTASKLNSAPYIRDIIQHWPEVEVTSRWPFAHVDGANPLWPEDCGAHASIFWTHDEEDVRKADIVLLFGSETDVLRGGLVEAGMALGLGKSVIVVGSNPSYGTWQYHPRVYRVKDLETARSLLSLLALDLATR